MITSDQISVARVIISLIFGILSTSFAFLPINQISESLNHRPVAQFSTSIGGAHVTRGLSSKTFLTSQSELERCLRTEYESFFSPLEERFYSSQVEFIDPLVSFVGIDSYRINVDMLAGRSILGRLLFKDASILLHNFDSTNVRNIQTRWTLQFTFKALPWQPRAIFSGVSRYTLDDDRLILKQEDFWDSINLCNGTYRRTPKLLNVLDFLSQLRLSNSIFKDSSTLSSYILLRRGNGYDVRQYFPCIVATIQKCESLDNSREVLSSHLKSLGLSTTQKVTFDLDSIAEKQTSFTVTSTDSHALKVAIAQATAIPGAIKFQEVPERVVAVRRFASRFDVKLGQELSKQLARDVFDDGLAAEISSLSDKIIVSENNDHKSQTGEACFDEVRVILSQHPWIHKLSNL